MEGHATPAAAGHNTVLGLPIHYLVGRAAACVDEHKDEHQDAGVRLPFCDEEEDPSVALHRLRRAYASLSACLAKAVPDSRLGLVVVLLCPPAEGVIDLAARVKPISLSSLRLRRMERGCR